MKPIYPPVGFHGDTHLLNTVDWLASRVDYFVETGSNIAATLHWFANRHENIQCYSCEPGDAPYQRAMRYTARLPNVKLQKLDASKFLRTLHPNLFDQNVLFWLDAHGRGFEWQLEDEISFITNTFTEHCYVLIDDFKIPDQPCFQFDRYNGQVCSYDYIKDQITVPHRLYYPSYTEHTSKYHPLVGWGLIEIGFGYAEPLLLEQTKCIKLK